MFYPDETVRLLRDIPDAGLVEGKECHVVRASANDESNFATIEVKYYADGAAHSK